MPFKSLLNDKYAQNGHSQYRKIVHISGTIKKKLMQPCNRRFDRLITIDCMLLKRICRRTPKPFVPNVFTEQAYVFNSGIQYQE